MAKFMPEGGCEVSRVCRFVEAHAFLGARRVTQLPTWCGAYSLRSLAALPYSPALKCLQCPDPLVTHPICDMLAAHPAATLQLTALDLGAHADASACTALVAALANSMQLVDLCLNVFLDDRIDDDDADLDSPVLQLPQLPQLAQLRSLDLRMRVTDDDDAATGLGLAHLTAMQQLTRLAIHLADRRMSTDAEAYAVATMQPVANALASLTALRQLQLAHWTTVASPAVHVCWRTLASALPTLPHLDALTLFQIIDPLAFNPRPIITLSSSLSCLSSLRHLLLTGVTSFNSAVDAAHSADCRAASTYFAAAVGALTGLQSLDLNGLDSFLSQADCQHHLRGLTRLLQLRLSYLSPEPPGEEADGAGLVSMLSGGMTRLRVLMLLDRQCCAKAMYRLVTEAVPALPVLETLVLPNDSDLLGTSQMASCRSSGE